jgi:hypothetical protein
MNGIERYIGIIAFAVVAVLSVFVLFGLVWLA